jgi:hypothetical protein
MHDLFGDASREDLIAAIAVIEPIASGRVENRTGAAQSFLCEIIQNALEDVVWMNRG